MDSNRGRRSLTLHFLRRVESEAARGVDGVDGVAGALALPGTISSSVCGTAELRKRAELQFA